jgi:hypothetical protein
MNEGLWNIILNRNFPQYSGKVEFVFVEREIPDKIIIIRPNIIIVHESLRLIEDEAKVKHMLHCAIAQLYPNVLIAMLRKVRQDNSIITDEVVIQKMAIDALLAQGVSRDTLLDLYIKSVAWTK